MYHSKIADINECELDTDGCSHNCTNTVGSFFCWCPEGLKIGDDGLTCEGDFNELNDIK